MTKLPKSIEKLMNSAAYRNSMHPGHRSAAERVTNFFASAYPNTEYDATGKMVDSEQDLENYISEEEFEERLAAIDEHNDFVHAQMSDMRDRGGDGEITSNNYIIEYITDDGNIEDGECEVLGLEISQLPSAYVWHSDGNNTCDECADLDGAKFTDEDDIPESPHPNCQCFVEEEDDDDFEDIPADLDWAINGIAKQRKEQKEMERKTYKIPENNKHFDAAFEKLKEVEGGYTNGRNQIKDEPTNMGIKQSTLDKYNKKFHNKNFPKDVEHLELEHAKEIYKDEYWNNTKIPNIENDRIRNAVFDMNVMSNPNIMTKTVQNALNSYANAGLEVDGVMGSKTINAINSISSNQVSDFMDVLKSERMESLRGMINWPTAKNGWKDRTMAY